MGFVMAILLAITILNYSLFLLIITSTFGFVFLLFIFSSRNGYDGHNSIRWILPILKLSSELIKIDGDIKDIEVKRVEKYLISEFTEKRAKESISKFQEYLEKDFNVRGVCEKLNRTNELGEKVQILHFLIKLAISDRFLSNKEEQFLVLIMKWLRIPSSYYQSILSLHNFIYENEARNRKSKPKRSTYRKDKSYEILGIPTTSTLEEVKKAYRELAKVYHPDKVRDKKLKESATKQFQAITDAYETIKKEKG